MLYPHASSQQRAYDEETVLVTTDYKVAKTATKGEAQYSESKINRRLIFQILQHIRKTTRTCIALIAIGLICR